MYGMFVQELLLTCAHLHEDGASPFNSSSTDQIQTAFQSSYASIATPYNSKSTYCFFFFFFTRLLIVFYVFSLVPFIELIKS
jgi:hypothetical protein